MHNYLATVRIDGKLIKTAIYAESPQEARLLLQRQYGMNSIARAPTAFSEAARDTELADSTLKPIQPKKPIGPMTPERGRINALKQGVMQAQNRLQAERDRQHQKRQSERTLKQNQQQSIPEHLQCRSGRVRNTQ